jgi:hypothetical protein
LDQLNRLLLLRANIDEIKLKKLYKIGEGGQAEIFRLFDFYTKKSFAQRIDKNCSYINAIDEIEILDHFNKTKQ